MIFLFIIHDGLRREMFKSLYEKAQANGIKSYIICFSIREYFWFLTKGFDSKTISLIQYSDSDDIIDDLESTIDVAAGFINIKSASKIYHSTYKSLNKYETESANIYIFGGNGLHSFDKAILKFKNENKHVYSVFTELSNIDGKLFFDSLGSNASSFFYSLLKNNEINFKKCNGANINEWKNNYCKSKLNNHNVKQATQKRSLKNFVHRLSGIIEFITRLPSYQRFKIDEALYTKKKVMKKLYMDEWNPYKDNIDGIGEFILFPLQVFGDSQIKLHSKIDNEKALYIACKEALKLKLPLVVKPHPAEPDASVLKKILEMKKSNKFFISTDNTFSLIKKSKKVIVINSTVGLEAIFCNKEVIFLGDSFYKYFVNDDVLSYYINEWLVDIDIFEPSVITDTEFRKIINIAKNKHHA
uniref:WepM n=1 Tax=Cronobacter sakazakii TaxID=28141 RepID=I1W2A1_CROSK|nr:WepM [Cronobacter sakazakii]